MDLLFNDEHADFRAAVRRFAADIAPGYLERSRQHSIDHDLLRTLAELGVTTMLFSPAVGGAGADAVSVGIAAEEIGRRDPALALAAMIGVLGPHIVEGHATPVVKADVIPRLLSGEALIAMAMTEPQGGSDVSAHTMHATRCQDGWRLHGVKTSVTNAANARYAVVTCRDENASRPTFSAFLVDLENDCGIHTQRFEDHGARLWGRGELAFDDVFVNDERLLGHEGQAMSIVLSGLDFNRAVIGLACVGAATQAVEDAGEYAAQRSAFGGSLLTKQGVAFPLVEHATRLEAARWLCYRTLWLRDNAHRHVKEAAMVKWWAPLVAREALQTCLLTYGHTGYSSEHPVGQMLLDVMGCEIGDGTAQIQKLVIARELFGREHAPR